METKTYRLAKSVSYFHLFIICMMMAGGVIAGLNMLFFEGLLMALPFLILWFGACAFVGYKFFFKIPLEIRIRGDQSIEFRCFLKRTVLLANEIQSIKSHPFSYGIVSIKHTRGRIDAVMNMDGFHEFITTVKALNSAIELKGC